MLSDRIRSLASGEFARNLGWLGAAEVGVRITRLLATIALARCLGPEGYGVAAIALTLHEILTVFARQGLGAKVIQCEESEVEGVAHAVHRLNWYVGCSLFLVQLGAGWAAARIYDRPELFDYIGTLAFIHLLFPFAMLPTALLRRAGRLKIVALAQVFTVGSDNLLTAAFALAGMGPWAFVLPKLLSTPVWIVVVRKHSPWRPSGVSPADWRPIVRFSRRVLGAELLDSVRNQMDYLLVGRVLGMEALGIYYFAFNAGLGFSMTVIRSFADSLYPHLCNGRDRLKERFTGAYRTISVTGVPLILAQCVLAPLYVPIVFGEEWAHAVPVLVLVCLSALPRLCGVGASQLLRALDRTDLDLRWSSSFTVLLAAALGLSVSSGILWVAFAVFATHALVLPWFALRAYRSIPEPLPAHA